MRNIMTSKVIKNLICCSIILLPFQGSQMDLGSLNVSNTQIETSAEEVPVPTKVVLMDLNEEFCDTNCFLLKNDETLEFMVNTFGVNKDLVIEDLINRNKDTLYDEYNIGLLTDDNGNLKTYNSFEEGLIEYLYVYCKENSQLVDNTRVAYTGDAKYVENLIRYYTQIYTNVDTTVALSIGAAESGYYKVTYMLKYNNIYGGMSNTGYLIKYKNIEYGVLTYVRMLSKNYYAKGLDTIEKIGTVYCPTYNSNGNKVASSHWLSLVRKAMNYYEKESNVTIEMLSKVE